MHPLTSYDSATLACSPFFKSCQKSAFFPTRSRAKWLQVKLWKGLLHWFANWWRTVSMQEHVTSKSMPNAEVLP